MAKKGKKGGGGGGGGKAKNLDKKKEKVIADRTFGMKNKGGKKARTAIQQLKNSQKSNKQLRIEEQKKLAQKKSKLAAQQEKDELSKLFKAVQDKPKDNLDPKSVICAFFKKGACTKGKKCRYSHDWSQVRKTEKLDIYSDRREDEVDEMKNWDQSKLETVVKSKENRCQTEIICKHFLDALERQQYGYFWVCPNGGDQCMYRHALPPGYVLKTKKEKEQDAENTEDAPALEETLELMREALASRTDLTKVTLESFNAWKLRKKEKAAFARQEKAKEATKKGKPDILSGRDLFAFDPTVFADDEEADDEQYVIQSDDEEKEEDEVEEYIPKTIRENLKGKDLVVNGTSKSDELTAELNASTESVLKMTAGNDGDGIVVGDESLFLNEDLDDIDFSDDEGE